MGNKPTAAELNVGHPCACRLDDNDEYMVVEGGRVICGFHAELEQALKECMYDKSIGRNAELEAVLLERDSTIAKLREAAEGVIESAKLWTESSHQTFTRVRVDDMDALAKALHGSSKPKTSQERFEEWVVEQFNGRISLDRNPHSGPAKYLSLATDEMWLAWQEAERQAKEGGDE